MSTLEEKEETTEEQEETSTDKEMFSLFLGSGAEDSKPKSKTIGIYGDINEESASEMVYTLIALHEESIREAEVAEAEEEVSPEPIKVIISTHGGVAHEMFSIYDTYRMVQQDCEIHTVGL